MELTVKRSELGGLKSVIASAEADPAYAGSANFGGKLVSDGSEVVLTLTVLDESAPS
jgi:hypothetical protein